MTSLKLICLNATWSRHGIQYSLEKITKKTATFAFQIANGLSGTVKATHELTETDYGNFFRIFTLDNGVMLKYNYKTEKVTKAPEKCYAMPPVFNTYINFKEIECPICYSNKAELITNCGHTYCAECFENISKCAFCKMKK